MPNEVDRWLSEQRRRWHEWLPELEAEPTDTSPRAFVESFDDVEPILRRQLNEVAAGRYERKPSVADWARPVARRPLGLQDVSEEQILEVERRMLDRLRHRHQETQVAWVDSSHNVPLVLPDELSEMIAGFAGHLGG